MKHMTAAALAALCVLALGAAGIYQIRKSSVKTMKHMDELDSQSDEAFIELQAALSTEAVSETVLPEQAEVVTEGLSEDETDQVIAAHQIIFVGDSRTVGCERAEKELEDTCVYIGESGEGYDWFAASGLSQLKSAISQYPETPVVFNLGVNDTDNIDRYLALYETILSDYPDTSFYFMSVNPVTEDSVHVTNEHIEAFNQALRIFAGDTYIDTYTWMTTYGFVSVDGVHYSEAQYRAIHDCAVLAIAGFELPEEGVTEAAEESIEETIISETIIEETAP